MSKQFFFSFGTDPRTNTGLAPTFVTLRDLLGNDINPKPSISEIATSGFYTFQYANVTLPLVLQIDGGNTLDSSIRYVKNVLDPIQYVDEKVGFNFDSFGTVNTDPTTMFGFLKRLQEFLEGDAAFAKATGLWTVQDRAQSVTLALKTLTNTITQATKT